MQRGDRKGQESRCKEGEEKKKHPEGHASFGGHFAPFNTTDEETRHRGAKPQIVELPW